MKIKLILLSIFVAFAYNLQSQTINKSSSDKPADDVKSEELNKYLGIYSSIQL